MRPTAAAIVTCATMPVTNVSPIDWSSSPSAREPRAPSTPVSVRSASEPTERSTLQARAAVASTGISIATEVTTTAEPTVARGLWRMMRNAAS